MSQGRTTGLPLLPAGKWEGEKNSICLAKNFVFILFKYLILCFNLREGRTWKQNVMDCRFIAFITMNNKNNFIYTQHAFTLSMQTSGLSDGTPDTWPCIKTIWPIRRWPSQLSATFKLIAVNLVALARLHWLTKDRRANMGTSIF